MADDLRIAEWSLRASAGTTTRLVFTSTEALASLSVYTGGTVTDVDDLADADEHAATLSGGNLIATVDLAVPTGGSVPLRLDVDGAVVTVGRLIPSTSGTADPAESISLVAADRTYALTVPGIVVLDVAEVTQAELDAEAALARNADNLTSGTVADARIPSTIARDAEVAAGYQPLDADLTAIADLTTTAWGRSVLTWANAAAGRTALELGTAATMSPAELAADAALTGAFMQPPPVSAGQRIAVPGTTGSGSVATAGTLAASVLALPSGTYDKLETGVTVAGAGGSVVRLGLYSTANGVPDVLLAETAALPADGVAVVTGAIGPVTLTAGFYWIGVVAQGGDPTIWSLNPGTNPYLPRGPGAAITMGAYTKTAVTGALPSTWGLALSVTSYPRCGAAIWRSA